MLEVENAAEIPKNAAIQNAEKEKKTIPENAAIPEGAVDADVVNFI